VNLRSISLLPAGASTDTVDISGSPIKQSDDGSFKLGATDAEIDGMNAQLELPPGATQKEIGYWKDRDTSLAWAINVRKPGKYRVELNYALTPSSAGSKVAVTVGDQTVNAKPTPGRDWRNFKTGKIGEVTLDRVGDVKVVLKAISKPVDFVINLHSVCLVPADIPTGAIDIRDKPATEGSDGSFRLGAASSEIDGQTARLEGGDKKYIVWWSAPDSIVQWPLKVDKPGVFKIELTYSLAENNGSSHLEIDVGGQRASITLNPSSGLDDFKTAKCGEVALKEGANLHVTLTSTKEPGGLVMHLRSLTLVRARK
jgi:predicted secreted protein